MNLEGWGFAKEVKEALLRRFTGELEGGICMYLSSELTLRQGKADGNKWKLSAFFTP